MVRVGIGGWVFDAWRDNFYPPGWPQARELEYAAQRLGAIEINSTFYALPSAASCAKWRDAVPQGFRFAVKGSRFIVQKRVLGENGEAVTRFVTSVKELGDRLGPMLWQLGPNKRFDPDDLDAFLALLPRKLDGHPLRHALEVRHESFACAEFVALARRHGVAIVFTDSVEHPRIADASADFVYARLVCSAADEPQGYPAAALDSIANAARVWAAGGQPADLPTLGATPADPAGPREAFVFFINGAKERAPAAAMGLIERLG